MRGGGQEKKSERANNTGQVRGACQTGRQKNRAGVQGHRPRRKGVRTVQNGLVRVDMLTACIGREKGDKYSKVRGVRHMGAGQEREI